jgi:hypothetical protein
LAWDTPAFGDFLEAERRGAGPGFVAACLVIHRADRLARAERAALGRRIMSDRREALIPGLGRALAPRLAVALLASLPAATLTPEVCEDFLVLMTDPAKSGLLRRGQPLTAPMLRVLRRLPAWICTGNLPRLLADLEPDDAFASAFFGLVRVVERDWRDQCDALRQSLRQARDAEHLPALVTRWQVRLQERAALPPPPFSEDAVLKPLSTAPMLRAEALRMRNCIASYLPEIACGDAYFYAWNGFERACILLRRRASGGWCLGEALGVANAPLSAETERRIRAAIQARLNPAAKPQPRRARAPRRVAAQLTLAF